MKKPSQTAACSQVRFTVWTASQPISKTLALDADGKLQRTASVGGLHEAEVCVVEGTPADVLAALTNVQSTQAFSYGIPQDLDATRMVTKAVYERAKDRSQLMARTNEQMAWPSGPGLLMLDYDPEGDPLNDRDLLKAFYQLVPSMEHAAHIWAPSASSFVYKGKSKNPVRGLAGQRVLVAVADATDIPRAGRVLFQRSWLQGHGRIEVSSAGTAMVRGIIDSSVFQPTRVDFVGPATCVRPLEQRRPKAKLIGNPEQFLDTRTAIPDLSADESAAFDALVSAAKASKAGLLKCAREAFLKKAVAQLMTNGCPEDEAYQTVERALDDQVLSDDFVLIHESGQPVAVGELLKDPKKWHHEKFHDPIEPDYRGDNRIARASLLGCIAPTIHSFAHGGRHFQLGAQRTRVLFQDGQRDKALTEVAGVLRSQDRFFNRLGSIVEVTAKGEVKAAGKNLVRVAIDKSVALLKVKKDSQFPMDTPDDWGQLLLDGYATQFRALRAAVTAPTLDLKDGRLVTAPGYDAACELWVCAAEPFAPIPNAPSIQQVTEALGTLWAPVQLFPYATVLDQTVMLTALLTAAIRPVLPTAPAFAFDAPIQGSGKTLLAKVLAALAGGMATTSAPPQAGKEDELRKRLFANLRQGANAIILDNVVGEVESPVLATLLTSETFSDRVLQVSQVDQVTTNALVLLTGNNIQFSEDLLRRVLKCRIDPQSEQPHGREFDFDPLELTLRDRQRLISSALTLIRAYLIERHSNGLPRPRGGRMASFEDWDDTVRQTVCWLADKQAAGAIATRSQEGGIRLPEVSDPMEAVNIATTGDAQQSQLGKLLEAWCRERGHDAAVPVTIAQLVVDAHTEEAKQRKSLAQRQMASKSCGAQPAPEPEQSLLSVLKEIAMRRGETEVNPKVLGKYLSANQDRVAGGLRVRKGGQRQKTTTWLIEEVRPAQGSIA